jgi:hypothetical protein
MRWKNWFALFLVPGLMLSLGWGSGNASPPFFEATPAITTTATGLTLVWRAADPIAGQQADGTWAFSIPGFEQIDRPGWPILPVKSVLIALPSQGEPTLVIEAVLERKLPLPGNLRVAAEPQGVQLSPNGSPSGGAWTPAGAKPFAPAVIALEPVGVLRGVRLARLVFIPLRPDGAGLTLTSELRVSVRFGSQAGGTATPPKPDPWLAVLQEAVINPGQVVPAERAVSPESSQGRLPASAPSAVIEVQQVGLTAVAYEDLAAIGFPVAAVNPVNLHLRRAGQAVAYQWQGDADALFEAGERLLFFAGPRFSRWTQVDAYFLQEQETPGLRMALRAAAPKDLLAGAAWLEQHFETNLFYTPNCMCGQTPAGFDGDRWVWEELWKPDQTARSYAFELPALDAGQPATLRVRLIGRTNLPQTPDHRVAFALNGTDLGALAWDGQKAVTATLTAPAGVLLAGENALELELTGLPEVNIEAAWLDAFSLEYARGSAPVGEALLFRGEASPHEYTLALADPAGLALYQVTDPNQPERVLDFEMDGDNLIVADAAPGRQRYLLVSPAQALAPAGLRLASALRATGTQAIDTLILTHKAFKPALAPLIELRESQGLQVLVEDVQAVYDHYGEGRVDPAALRAYLAEAYQNWPVPPTYVLLVGDGNYDPKGYLPDSAATFIPPYLAEVDPWMGETAADNRFVTVDGDDNLPDMHIGRLPVNSLAEAQSVVQKIVQYEVLPMWGDWNARILLSADDADGAGDYAAMLDELAEAYIAAPFEPVRLYYTPPDLSLEEMQAAVLANWNLGAGLSLFAGHSSILQWGSEAFFHLDQLSELHNAPKLPVAVDLTCFTGSFHIPGFVTLDEALLRWPGGGVIAAWGPTGLGIYTGHDALAAGFLQRIYQQGEPDLGPAILAGKLRLLAEKPVWADLIDTYGLLGDPATALNLDTTRLPQNPLYLPLLVLQASP